MTTATAVPASGAAISVDLLRAAGRSESFPKEWSEEKRRRALDRYGKFLRLAAKYPDTRLAPCRDIDEFWHLHMLHPVAYARDCDRLFGGLLDHDGGFGKAPEEEPVLIGVWTETARLFELEFGEQYREPDEGVESGATNCWHDCQSRCWHECSSKA
jgi:uncharacterized protein DUF1399